MMLLLDRHPCITNKGKTYWKADMPGRHPAGAPQKIMTKQDLNPDSAIELVDATTGQCPRCRVGLVEGWAFTQLPIPVLEVTTDEDRSAKLVACMKCPACGYSEEVAGDNGNAPGNEFSLMSDAVRAHYAVFGRKGLCWCGLTRQYVIDEPFRKH